LGKKSLGTSEFPPIKTLIATGNVAFRQHASGHTDQSTVSAGKRMPPAPRPYPDEKPTPPEPHFIDKK
jgi:hypothetical protein